MAISTQWQLAHDAARRYHDILVPVLLRPAARILVRHAAIRPGDTVLDVGCGTGEAARMAAAEAGPRGRVVGLDMNAGMLEVAAALRPPEGAPIEWREGNAERLPIADASMDVVLCAQTLQFVPDREAALHEMRRVLKRGGRAAVSVWSRIEDSPYFVALVRAVERHLGEAAAAGIKAVFGLQDGARVAALLRSAGFVDVAIRTERLLLDLAPLGQFVPRHLSATPLAAAFASAGPAGQALVDNVIQDMAREDASATPIDIHIALGAVP